MGRILLLAALVLLLLWLLRGRGWGRGRRGGDNGTGAGRSKRGGGGSGAAALPRDRRVLLQARVGLWRALHPELQERLLPRIEAFLARVPFIGAGGLTVTEDMRTIIAAQACLVTLGGEDAGFEALHGITLHPDEFVVEEAHEDEDTGIVTEGWRTLSGQSVDGERIVLSWRDVEEAEQRDDGYNVVIHEFTHFLEQTRPGGDPAAHRALETEHDALCDAVDRGEPTLLDPYGAEDLTEFLAVAAEMFFSLPGELKARHPSLYDLLRVSFALDPASWPGDRSARSSHSL
ncbi:MAG: zinc-dependent peptidase [Gammaproteobacteria bacterium]